MENASGVFATAADKQAASPNLKDLHAKIGQQALAWIAINGVEPGIIRYYRELVKKRNAGMD